MTTLWINQIIVLSLTCFKNKCFHNVIVWKAHIPRCWALSMRHCTAAAWCLSLFSVLLFILSPPSPQWKRLGAKMTERLLLSILFSAHLKVAIHTLYMCLNTKETLNSFWKELLFRGYPAISITRDLKQTEALLHLSSYRWETLFRKLKK